MQDGLVDRHKTIAFISCAPHQSRLFAFLRKALPSGTGSTIVNVNLLPLTPSFWAAALKVLLASTLSDQITDPIIALDYKKYLVNRAGFLQPLDRFIEWLWRKVAAIYFTLFIGRLRRQHTDLLVVWGGFQLPIAAAIGAARQAGIRLLFCENGYLPRTIVMDSQGINAGNSLMGRPADFYRATAVPDALRKGLLGTPLIARPLKGGATASEAITLPEQFVFLPLQVHDDSQILLYSPQFPDIPSVVRFCVAGVEAANRQRGTQLKLVVKEHPSDHGRIDYSRAFREFREAVFTKSANTQDLIEKCAAVITVNSTVGIEAMLQLKPVVTLGEAFYAVPGLARACSAKDDLGAVLREAIETPPDRELIEHFLYFLRYDYLVPLDRNNLAASDPVQAVARIMKALS